MGFKVFGVQPTCCFSVGDGKYCGSFNCSLGFRALGEEWKAKWTSKRKITLKLVVYRDIQGLTVH